MAYKVINGKVVKVKAKNAWGRRPSHTMVEPTTVADLLAYHQLLVGGHSATGRIGHDLVEQSRLANRSVQEKLNDLNANYPSIQEFHDTVKASLKGKFGQNCNRTHCQRPPAYWYNCSTNKYYCDECAYELNTDRFNRKDSLQIWGHDLCVKVSEPVTADNEDLMHARAKMESGGTRTVAVTGNPVMVDTASIEATKEQIDHLANRLTTQFEPPIVSPSQSAMTAEWLNTLQATMQALNIQPLVFDLVDFPPSMKDITPSYDVISAANLDAIRENNRGVVCMTHSASESSSAAEYEDLKMMADKFTLPPLVQMRSKPITDMLDLTVVGGAIEMGNGEVSIVDPTLGSHDLNAQLFFAVDWADPNSERSVTVTMLKNRSTNPGTITDAEYKTFTSNAHFVETNSFMVESQSQSRINRNGVAFDTESPNITEYSEREKKDEGGSSE